MASEMDIPRVHSGHAVGSFVNEGQRKEQFVSEGKNPLCVCVRVCVWCSMTNDQCIGRWALFTGNKRGWT